MLLVDREVLLTLLKTLASPPFHPSLIMLSLTPATNVQAVTFVSPAAALVC